MEEKKGRPNQRMEDVTLVRVLGKDIRGDIKLVSALTKINGISWAFSNAVCRTLNLDEGKMVQELDEGEIAEIEKFVQNPELPSFLLNRRNDLETGEDQHVSGSDLRLRKEFDIKRLKKIKSYRGARHNANLPVRGQRTKGNFRKNRRPSVAAAKKKAKA